MKTAFVISASPTKFSAVSYASDLRSGIENLARLGFDGVEVHIRDPKEVDIGLIRETASRCNLGVCAIGTGQSYVEDGLSLCHSDPQIRKQAVARLKDAIDFASDLGALVIIGLIRGRTTHSMSAHEAYVLLDAGLSECLSLAAVKGVKIVIEPINRYETDMLNTVAETLNLISHIGSDNLGILLDTFHMNIEEPSIRESIVLAGEKIFHVHTADSNRWAPGFGHVDFSEVVAALREVGYEGYLSGEILPLPDVMTASKMTIQTLSATLSTSH
jgi:sugar phosphate isomerase/epimerase